MLYRASTAAAAPPAPQMAVGLKGSESSSRNGRTSVHRETCVGGLRGAGQGSAVLSGCRRVWPGASSALGARGTGVRGVAKRRKSHGVKTPVELRPRCRWRCQQGWLCQEWRLTDYSSADRVASNPGAVTEGGHGSGCCGQPLRGLHRQTITVLVAMSTLHAAGKCNLFR